MPTDIEPRSADNSKKLELLNSLRTANQGILTSMRHMGADLSPVSVLAMRIEAVVSAICGPPEDGNDERIDFEIAFETLVGKGLEEVKPQVMLQGVQPAFAGGVDLSHLRQN